VEETMPVADKRSCQMTQLQLQRIPGPDTLQKGILTCADNERLRSTTMW
jgi:hypothetical protein